MVCWDVSGASSTRRSNGSARNNHFVVGHQQHYEREMQPDFRIHADVFFAVSSTTPWMGIYTVPGSH